VPDRKSGFLHPSERAYLNEEGIYRYPQSYEDVKSGGRRAKSRIQNEVATVPQLQMLLLDFLLDLNAAQNLQRTDAETWIEWESRTLPAVTQELEWLRDTVNQMVEIAKRDQFEEESEEIRAAVEPLYPGNFHPGEVVSTGGVGAYEPPEARHQWTADELETRFEITEMRFDGLETLLKKDELAGILDYIATNGRCELPERKINDDGEGWSKVASEHLTPDLATKLEHSQSYREYEITPHGTAVLECWKRLRETTAVRMAAGANPDGTDREHIATALDLHGLRKRPYR
jgi:hypothetical protein